MKVENGIIVECTENELFKYYLEQEWDNIYSFPDYMNRCINAGTKIIEKDKFKCVICKNEYEYEQTDYKNNDVQNFLDNFGHKFCSNCYKKIYEKFITGELYDFLYTEVKDD